MASLSPAAVVFSDTFGSSSLNPASYPTPTATSAGYTVASTKAATSALSAGDLRLAMGATTSGFVETQARFASTPVALTATGDFIQLTATFTDTSNILAGGTASAIYAGLYNTGGNNPAVGLQASGLTATAGSSFATGNGANFQGYVGRVVGSTGTGNQIYTRPLQNGAGTTSANQELLGNNAGGGLYNNPAGTNVGSSATSAVTLTNGSIYTSDVIITLNADGTETIVSTLYSGAGTGGTALATQTGTTVAGTTLATSFDGLALGYRQSGTSLATQVDYSAITVTTGSAPEPASLALLALGGGALIRRRRA